MSAEADSLPKGSSRPEGQFRLDGKRILLVVTGGIAAYKCCHLVREIIRADGSVQVVMTPAATRFITPLTFATLSGMEVLTLLFPETPPAVPVHLQAAREADVLVVAPASADFIGKLSGGLADDLASNMAMAFRGPTLLAPAMNHAMWSNPAVQRNLELLRQRGVSVVGPAEGEMAGIQEEAGVGRMSESEAILASIEELVSDCGRWRGRRVVVTSGPTREALDPVRFISNRSSGRMGDAVARRARLRGAEVVLIRGGGASLPPPFGVELVTVDTAEEMFQAVKAHFDRCDLLVMAAAVADWRCETAAATKIKKREGLPRISWRKTDDILKWAGKNKRHQTVVGFALETERHLEEARQKLVSKNADLIALNDPTRPGSAFGADTIQLTLIPREGDVLELPTLPKWEAADRLLDAAQELFRER